MATQKARFLLRSGTAAEWTTVNPVLAAGEPGYETDTKFLRVGDGLAVFTALPRYLLAADLSAVVALAGAQTITGLKTFSNGINMPDLSTLTFGTGADFSIVHDTANTVMAETGTGALVIRASAIDFQKADGTEAMATFVADGTSQLRFDSSVKFETRTGGVKVFGNMEADTFSGSGVQSTLANVGNQVPSGAAVFAAVPGINQAWGDYTASRASTGVYQNTTGKEIDVKVISGVTTGTATFEVGGSPAGLFVISQTTTGGGTAVTQTNGGSVPNGWYYRYTGSISGWREKR